MDLNPLYLGNHARQALARGDAGAWLRHDIERTLSEVRFDANAINFDRVSSSPEHPDITLLQETASVLIDLALDVGLDNRAQKRSYSLSPAAQEYVKRFTFAGSLRGAMKEGLQTGFAFPANLAAAVVAWSRESDNVTSLAVSDVLRRQWFSDMVHQSARTDNGVLGRGSTDLYLHYRPAQDLFRSFAYRSPTAEPFRMNPDGTFGYTDAVLDHFSDRYRERNQTHGQSGGTSGCPVRHMTYNTVDQEESIDFYASGIELFIDGLERAYTIARYRYWI